MSVKLKLGEIKVGHERMKWNWIKHLFQQNRSSSMKCNWVLDTM